MTFDHDPRRVTPFLIPTPDISLAALVYHYAGLTGAGRENVFICSRLIFWRCFPRTREMPGK